MAYCGACGRQLDPADAFCPGCGRPTSGAATDQRLLRLAIAAMVVIAAFAVVAVIVLVSLDEAQVAPPPAMPSVTMATTTGDPIREAETDGERAGVELPDVPTAPPLLTDDLVVVPLQDELVAFERSDLSLRWRSPCELGWWPQRVPQDLADHALVRCESDLTLVDLPTGGRVWADRGTGAALDLRASAKVFVIGDEKGIAVHDLADGAVLWVHPNSPDAAMAGPVFEVAGEAVILGDGDELVAYDAFTAVEQWRAPVPAASILYAEGELFVRSTTGEVLRLDASSGGVIWRNDREIERFADASVLATSDETVVLASPEQLIAVDRADGGVLWHRVEPSGLLAAGGTTIALSGVVVPVSEVVGIELLEATTGADVGWHTQCTDAALDGDTGAWLCWGEQTFGGTYGTEPLLVVGPIRD